MWFKSYRTTWKQQCLINGWLSSQRNLLCGVPQGSILGPLLFLIYINDLPNCLKFTTPCLYADDAQTFTSGLDISVLTNNISSDLKNLSDWVTVNKLQFHPLKTKLMVVGSTYNLNTKSGDLLNVISIDDNLGSSVPSNKCLEVLLDEKLTFETHIEYTCKKECASIGALRRTKPFVPLCTLVTLYRSLIEPYFDYCSPLWDTIVVSNWKINYKNFKIEGEGLLLALHMMLCLQMCWITWNGKPLKPGHTQIFWSVALRSFHWNRTYTENFLKLCQLIVYIIGTLNLK